jgi:putative cardiolipin synthase
MAITGGRNLGDQYFTKGTNRNFLDLNVLAVGSIVMDLSASFDTFWNSSLAYPAAAVIRLSVDAAGPPTVHALLPSNSMAPEDSLEGELRAGHVTLEWAPGRLLADHPDKVESATRIDRMMLDQVIDLLRSAQTEVILVSPYFIPGATGMGLVREHRTRGVSVRVLTNSLASTDAPVAHIGYARYRLAMLEQGVELNELRPLVEGPRPYLSAASFGSSRASLHTKLINIDRQMLFVGSMNLDPRSAFENSEIGLVIDSPVLAQRVGKVFDDVVGNEDVWRLTLAPDRNSILWHSRSADHETTQSSEPDAGLWLRLELFFLGHLVPESLL